MADKIRKIGKWFWLNKERMVLICMVAFLCYQVYQVVYPPPREESVSHPRPDKEIPKDARPPEPSRRPPIDLPGSYASLSNQNPFWWYSGSSSASKDDGEITAEDLGLELLAIREVGDSWRAQLNTRTVRRRWYNEGEQFEEYILEEINPEEGTAVVYSERYARKYDLELP